MLGWGGGQPSRLRQAGQGSLSVSAGRLPAFRLCASWSRCGSVPPVPSNLTGQQAGHRGGLCLQYVSRAGAFSEGRMESGDSRAFHLLHRKIVVGPLPPEGSGNWKTCCWPQIGKTGSSFRQSSTAPGSVRTPCTTGSSARRLPGPAVSRLCEGDMLLPGALPLRDMIDSAEQISLERAGIKMESATRFRCQGTP